jgi:hypothetical protein
VNLFVSASGDSAFNKVRQNKVCQQPRPPVTLEKATVAFFATVQDEGGRLAAIQYREAKKPPSAPVPDTNLLILIEPLGRRNMFKLLCEGE